MKRISINKLTCSTYSVKDDSVRGIVTKEKSEIKIGDEIIIDNCFVLVTK